MKDKPKRPEPIYKIYQIGKVSVDIYKESDPDYHAHLIKLGIHFMYRFGIQLVNLGEVSKWYCENDRNSVPPASHALTTDCFFVPMYEDVGIIGRVPGPYPIHIFLDYTKVTRSQWEAIVTKGIPIEDAMTCKVVINEEQPFLDNTFAGEEN